jgi:hypothetical protein
MLTRNVEACGERPCFHKDCVATFGVSLALFDTEGESEDRLGLLEFLSQLSQAFHTLLSLLQTKLSRLVTLKLVSAQSMTDGYSMLAQDVDFRKEVAEKLGAGFDVPDPMTPMTPRKAVRKETEVAMQVAMSV